MTLPTGRSSGPAVRFRSNTESDVDSGASSASDDDDSEAVDNFLEELSRLEQELRDAERIRDQAVAKADQAYEELQNMEKQ